MIITDIRSQCRRENHTSGEISDSSLIETSMNIDQLDLIEEHASPSMTKQKCDKEVLSYVLGSIVRRKVACDLCQSELDGTDKSALISYKEIEGCKLVTPRSELVVSIEKIQQFMFDNLPQIGHLSNISQIFNTEILQRELVKFDFLNCKSDSNTREILLKEIINFFIRLFCKRTNENFEKEKYKNIEKI